MNSSECPNLPNVNLQFQSQMNHQLNGVSGPLLNDASQNFQTVPPEQHNLNYYQEYCRLFIANVVLTTQMKELISEKNELLQKLAKLQKKSEDLNSQSLNDDADDKKKRFRRIANEIDRHYKCPIESCAKSYGSEGSLNQHIKIKHPEYYQKILENDKSKLEGENANTENRDIQNEEDEEIEESMSESSQQQSNILNKQDEQSENNNKNENQQ